jgi:hypothetical protein
MFGMVPDLKVVDLLEKWGMTIPQELRVIQPEMRAAIGPENGEKPIMLR